MIDDLPRTGDWLDGPPAQRRATAPRESSTLGEAIVVAILTVIVVLIIQGSSSLRIERLYEDGSGELSDSRQFCIKGELCDAEAGR